MNENTQAERRPLEEGSRVGEYRIVRCLGSNGEGIFYLAQDCIVGDVVQLQEFFPAGIACRCDDADALQPLAGHATEFKYFRASFQDLYRILQQEKENSCLIPIVQLFEQNATVYVASEHLQVSTLEETLRQSGGRQCWCRAKKYLLPLYNSLSSLHKKGITHQGISPENILLDEENRVYWRGFSLLEMRTATGDGAAAVCRIQRTGAIPAGKLARRLDRPVLDRSGDLPGIDRCCSAGCGYSSAAGSADGANLAG